MCECETTKCVKSLLWYRVTRRIHLASDREPCVSTNACTTRSTFRKRYGSCPYSISALVDGERECSIVTVCSRGFPSKTDRSSEELFPLTTLESEAWPLLLRSLPLVVGGGTVSKTPVGIVLSEVVGCATQNPGKLETMSRTRLAKLLISTEGFSSFELLA